MRRPVRDDVFRRLAAARDVIHARHAERLELDELARAAGTSRYHFLRLFKDAYGVTPHAYLTQVRLDAAKTLLTADTATVTDVCFDVGFSSLGSFSTLFAERIGCPPGAWRKRFLQVAWTPRGPLPRIPWCFVDHFADHFAISEKPSAAPAI